RPPLAPLFPYTTLFRSFLLTLAAVAAATLATGTAARTVVFATFLLHALGIVVVQQFLIHALDRLGTRLALFALRTVLARRALGALAAGFRSLLLLRLGLADLTVLARLTPFPRFAGLTVGARVAGAVLPLPGFT